MRRGDLILALGITASAAACSPAPAPNTDTEIKREASAFPLDEYEIWDAYEALNDAQRANVQKAHMCSMFALAAAGDVTEWWVVLVEPGNYASLTVRLQTEAGVYVSDDAVFADNFGQVKTYRPPIAVDTDSFERYPFEGGWRVVAFAHFPNSPKGRMLHWEVTP